MSRAAGRRPLRGVARDAIDSNERPAASSQGGDDPATGRLVADPNGVLIRNANLQDLVSLVYGVARLRVTSDQMIDTDVDKRFWLTDVRYDVRIRGRLNAMQKRPPQMPPASDLPRSARALFAEDIARVEAACGRDLSAWRKSLVC